VEINNGAANTGALGNKAKLFITELVQSAIDGIIHSSLIPWLNSVQAVVSPSSKQCKNAERYWQNKMPSHFIFLLCHCAPERSICGVFLDTATCTSKDRVMHASAHMPTGNYGPRDSMNTPAGALNRI